MDSWTRNPTIRPSRARRHKPPHNMSSFVTSRAAGYAPGWLSDYATVGSALQSNYTALGPFSSGDVFVGMTYLWEIERAARASGRRLSETSAEVSASVLPPRGVGPGPSLERLDELRILCVATEAAYIAGSDFSLPQLRHSTRLCLTHIPQSPCLTISRSQHSHRRPRGAASMCRAPGPRGDVQRARQQVPAGGEGGAGRGGPPGQSIYSCFIQPRHRLM